MDDITIGYNSINAIQFALIWNKFDEDQSGFIEGKELDGFFAELSAGLLKKEPTKEEVTAIKEKFMSTYAKSGQISMKELAKVLLPSEEVFLLLFRRKIPLNSSVTFMQIWRKYDQNCSGFINVQELMNFIGDYVMIAGAKVTNKKLEEYAHSIMSLFDRNKDGLLDLQDMARLVNVSENFLLQFKIEDGTQEERRRDFEKIFNYYDQSKTGALEGPEVDGFVKDMMETIRGPINASELDLLKEKILKHMDKNKDGKIQKAELAMCLGVRLEQC